MDYKIRVIRRVGSYKIGHWEIIDKTEKVTEQAQESNQAEQKVSDPTPKVSNLDSKSVKPRPTDKATEGRK